MEERDSQIWEKVKSEIPRCQFDAIICMRGKMRDKGWKYIKARAKGLAVVLEVQDTAKRTHWLSVLPDGECTFLPVEMGCF